MGTPGTFRDQRRRNRVIEVTELPPQYAKLIGNLITPANVDWDNPDNPPKTFIDMSTGVPVEVVKEVKRDTE